MPPLGHPREVLLAADQPATSGASLPTLTAVLLIGGVILGFGYRLAVMHRANSDYKKTKAGLPLLRKAFWEALWAAVKFAFFMFIAFALLLSWVVHEVRAS